MSHAHTEKKPLDDASTEFLARELGTSSLSILQLAGDASHRRYYRVVVGDHSYVLMMWDPFQDDGRYPFLNVRSHFAKHAVRVPDVIAKAPELGLVLLEDLGDLTLERKFWENQNQSMAVPYYEQAIDELIKIHYSASNDRQGGCVAFEIAFDTDKLLWEMNYGREHLIEKLAGVSLSRTERAELDRIFLDICTRLDQQEKRICHRDYHSRNLMIKFGQVRVIDFQDARMGPIQYDLVSLVHDSYVDMNETMRGQILDYYIKRADEIRVSTLGLKPIGRNQFDSVFQLQMIQRCFKACGSFASFYNMREDTRYLKYIKPTLKKVVETLEPFTQYRSFFELIQNRGLLDFNYLNPTQIS